MKCNKLLALALALACAVGFAACGGKENSTDAAAEPVVNKEKKEIIMPAEVNGKYFTESTRHGVVYKGGSNGEKSILRGLTDEKEFHQALLDIGATPGDNVKADDMNTKDTPSVTVEGSKLDVFVTWEGAGKEIPFADIVKASEERPADFRFGGNLEGAKAKNTGCVLCLDTCAVGITSDAAYPAGTTQQKLVDFFGDESVLPKDGTRVDVIFRLAE